MIPNMNYAASATALAPSPSVSSEGAPASALSGSQASALPSASPGESAKNVAAETLKDPGKAKELTERVNALLAPDTNVALRFDLGDNNQVRSFQLVDKNTNEVVMQYPSEEALHLRDRLEAAAAKSDPDASQGPMASGLLLSTRA